MFTLETMSGILVHLNGRVRHSRHGYEDIKFRYIDGCSPQSLFLVCLSVYCNVIPASECSAVLLSYLYLRDIFYGINDNLSLCLQICPGITKNKDLQLELYNTVCSKKTRWK